MSLSRHDAAPPPPLTDKRSVTELLTAARERDTAADVLDKLFDRVYTTLRRLARGQRKRWTGEPSMETTALVHEAYLKLVGVEQRSWKSRSHFFAVSAQAMRHILINDARRKRTQKRGGKLTTLSLEQLRESLDRNVVRAAERAEVLVILDEALGRFERVHPRAARVVECRYFGGMTIQETGEALGISASTVSRDWKLAKAWLYREMKNSLGGPQSRSPNPTDSKKKNGPRKLAQM